MIVHLKETVSAEEATRLAELMSGLQFHDGEKFVIVNASHHKEVPDEMESYVAFSQVFDDDIQLASSRYGRDTRKIQIGKSLIGGNTGNTLVITGPCSVESPDQIESCAQFNISLNISVLRAGCFKPRTSPYTFQGLGVNGLSLLSEMRDKYDLQIISEVRDASHVEEVIDAVDIIQIGAKAMYDQGILRACGKAQKPVLLKRGFGSTLQEFVQAAEFILSLGNQQVMLCERGIRTFENKTRFTLDLCGVAFLKRYTNLPIFLDPSHAMGYGYGVPDLTRACVAMGIDGLLIESHPSPATALSDASQQLDFKSFQDLYKSLIPVATAVGRKIV